MFFGFAALAIKRSIGRKDGKMGKPNQLAAIPIKPSTAKRGPKKKPSGYNAKKAARDMLPSAIAALKDEIENGKGMARVNAVAQLSKLADVDRMDPEEINIEVNLIPISHIDDDGKIVLLKENSA